MIDKLIIRNYKSLREVSFDLEKINLFIGPNNSGKTNVFNALYFLFFIILQNKEVRLTTDTLRRIYYNFWDQEGTVFNDPVSFTFCKKTGEDFEYYVVEFWGLNDNNQIIKREFIGRTTKELPNDFQIGRLEDVSNILSIGSVQMFFSQRIPTGTLKPHLSGTNYLLLTFQDKKASVIKTGDDTHEVKSLFYSEANSFEIVGFLKKIAANLRIYSPDPYQIKKPGLLGTDEFVNSDASNLVSFFDNMRDGHPEIFTAIKNDLRACLPEIKDILFKKIKINGEISKQIVLVDQQERGFFSDEVSEGILYFMAIIAIIHQPVPPGFLLIEEPEKGIHPRRLHEIIHFIFELADRKDIQIFLTTHSPQVVNEFEDFPASVFVFDTENGETKVQNLLYDIIQVSHKKSLEKGLPKLDYTQTLGEHWVYGLLGGVPK